MDLVRVRKWGSSTTSSSVDRMMLASCVWAPPSSSSCPLSSIVVWKNSQPCGAPNRQECLVPGGITKYKAWRRAQTRSDFFWKNGSTLAYLLDLQLGLKVLCLFSLMVPLRLPKSLNQLAEFFLMNEGPRSEILPNKSQTSWWDPWWKKLWTRSIWSSCLQPTWPFSCGVALTLRAMWSHILTIKRAGLHC